MDSRSNTTSSWEDETIQEDASEWEWVDQSRYQWPQPARSNVNQENRYSLAGCDVPHDVWTGRDVSEEGNESYLQASALVSSSQGQVFPSREQESNQIEPIYQQAESRYQLAPDMPTTFYTGPGSGRQLGVPDRWVLSDPLPSHYNPDHFYTSVPSHPGLYSYSLRGECWQESNFSEDLQTWEPPTMVEEATSNFEELCLEDQASAVKKDPKYTSITMPKGYFKLGRVFETIRAGPKDGSDESYIFVVMINGSNIQNLAVVFAVGNLPKRFPGEDSPGLGEFPILVEKPSTLIDPALRLDLSKMYTVYHDIRVRNVGRIDRKHLKRLESIFLQSTALIVSLREDRRVFRRIEPDVMENFNLQIESPEPTYSPPVGQGKYSAISDNIKPGTRNLLQGHQSLQSLVANKPTKIEVTKVGSRSRPSSSSLRSSQLLRPMFKIHPSKHFQKGKVLMVLWSEPLAETTNKYDSDETDFSSYENEAASKFGEKSYHSIRRLVIVKAKKGHCLCIPILTYNRRGTTKSGVKAEDHAIIYSSQEPPEPLPGENGISKEPIRIEPTDTGGQLAIESRINYCKIYTVEHNVKVYFIGYIAKDSEGQFFMDFEESFSSD